MGTVSGALLPKYGHIPWERLKQETLNHRHALSDTWAAFFKVGAQEYHDLVKAAEGKDAWGNEATLALLSLHTSREVVVVTPAQIWIVAVDQPTKEPMVLKLAN